MNIKGEISGSLWSHGAGLHGWHASLAHLGPLTGPEHWGKLYPIADGNNQSPIDIKTSNTKQHDTSLKCISVSYNPATAKEIINVGHSFHVIFKDNGNQSVLKCGPLPDSYRLCQFHFHWGSTNDYGPEHTVDGAKYPGESSQTKAASQPDGLVIIDVLMKLAQFHSLLSNVEGCSSDSWRNPTQHSPYAKGKGTISHSRRGPLGTTATGKKLSLCGPSEAVAGGDCSAKKPLLRPPLYTEGWSWLPTLVTPSPHGSRSGISLTYRLISPTQLLHSNQQDSPGRRAE
ncbi:hypothetical protein MC885_016480, partial [Smutsia gigantea]